MYMMVFRKLQRTCIIWLIKRVVEVVL